MDLENISDNELTFLLMDCISWINTATELMDKGILPSLNDITSVESLHRLQFLEYTITVATESSRRWGYDFSQIKQEYNDLLKKMCRGNA